MVNKDYRQMFCCDDMVSHIYLLDQRITLDDGDKSDKTVYYSSKFNEYGLPVGDKISFIVIDYCPWCGIKLPNSYREQWFAELEELGIDSPLLENGYPEKYKSWAWWKK